MNKKITFVTFFVVILLMISPVTQSTGENTTQKIKDDLCKAISKSKAQVDIKNKIVKNLEQIEEIDDNTLNYIIKFKHLLEKSNNLYSNNFWLNMALIHFLWALYHVISGDQTAARYHLQRAVLDLILYIMLST